MTSDPVAGTLARWAEGLAPATRDQLSTYDLQALYDRAVSTRGQGERALVAAMRHWLRQLAPAAQRALSAYDREALSAQLLVLPAPTSRANGSGLPVPPREAADKLAEAPQAGAADAKPMQIARRPAPQPDPTGLGPPARLEHARAGGYTGDPCSGCGSLAVVRSGSCATCQDCGAQSGCG